MKTIILTLFLFFSSFLSAQWVYQTVTDGFDDPYKICYTNNLKGPFLKLENVQGKVSFYISGDYFCDDQVTYDFVFMSGDDNYKISGVGSKSTVNDNVLFLTFDLLNEGQTVISWFKRASKLKIRVNESYCDTKYYEFNMSKSSAALEFISK